MIIIINDLLFELSLNWSKNLFWTAFSLMFIGSDLLWHTNITQQVHNFKKIERLRWWTSRDTK